MRRTRRLLGASLLKSSPHLTSPGWVGHCLWSTTRNLARRFFGNGLRSFPRVVAILIGGIGFHPLQSVHTTSRVSTACNSLLTQRVSVGSCIPAVVVGVGSTFSFFPRKLERTSLRSTCGGVIALATPMVQHNGVLVPFLDLVTKFGDLPKSEIGSGFGCGFGIAGGETLQPRRCLSSKSISFPHSCQNEGPTLLGIMFHLPRLFALFSKIQHARRIRRLIGSPNPRVAGPFMILVPMRV